MMKELLPFWPQIIFIVLSTISLLRTIFLDGVEVKNTGSISKTWLSTGFYLFLLYSGGFFQYIGGAQIIYFILLGFIIIFLILATFGDGIKIPKTKTVSNSTIGFFLVMLLYWWGGFFDGIIAYLLK